jgi:NADH-quinone oxidoreductase subunit J
MMNAAQVVFYILGVFAVLCGIACITQRNPISSAVWLVGTMLALAGMYVILDAQFIGAIQVLVYAGAIMVLFLFVIMLLNLSHTQHDMRKWPFWLIGAGLVAGIAGPLLALRGYTGGRLASEVIGAPVYTDPAAALVAGPAAIQATLERGVVGAIAEPLFKTYLVPFEITSILLLVAAVGAVVIAKRKL